MTVEQARKWREKQNKKALIFCPFCVSKGVKHLKECPTLVEGFDPQTAHELTLEEREAILANKQ